MKIIDLLKSNAIEINADINSKDKAIEELIELHNDAGNLRDIKEYHRAILAREAQGTTAIGEGIAVPHAKSDSVKMPGLSAMTINGGIDYGAPDGRPSDILFMIAAPPDGDLHLKILSRLMAMLMEPEFCNTLRNAKTADEFLKAIDDKESEKYPDEKPAEINDTEQGYRILAVTACPTGIAHTYMAAEALERAGERLGYSLKAETNGSGGAKNVLTRREIAECDGIIIAADKNVDMSRFDGKPVVKASVSSGINSPEELINKIISGNAGIYHSESAGDLRDDNDDEGFARAVYKHLMNGVSHMLPFVVGGGVLIALGFLIDTLTGNATLADGTANSSFGFTNSVSAVVFWIGKAAFAFMLPILSGYIAQSVADRPGLLPGMVGGVFASGGHTLVSLANNGLDGDSSAVSGFLGALFAGFVAGFIVNLLKKGFSFLPDSMDGIKPVFIYPLFATVLIGLLMALVNPFIGILNSGIANLLSSLGNTSRIVLSVVLAAMMATDMGGPFNKAAYVFGTAAIADGNTWIMAAVMVGGMVPPIAIAISTSINKKIWTPQEIKSGPVNYLMGLCFITEGAIPYAASDPLRVIPSCMVGSAVSGALACVFRVNCPAPHGGIFTFVVCDHALLYIVALVAGSVAGAIMLSILKGKKALST